MEKHTTATYSNKGHKSVRLPNVQQSIAASAVQTQVIFSLYNG